MDALSKCAIILAAGKGTRMHSGKPKVLQTILGESMLGCVISALKPLFGTEIFIIAGHRADAIQAAFPDERLILQEPQLGTGHALLCALKNPDVKNNEYILIANGDTPLMNSDIVLHFMREAAGSDVSFASIILPDSGNYGRVVRKGRQLAAIIEAKEYNEEIYGAPSGEINSGLWLIRTSCAQKLLPLIGSNSASGEYYLTDLVALGLQNNMDVRGIPLGDCDELLGVNTPAELALMENRLAEKINKKLLEAGVIIHHPAALRVGPSTRIEPGVELNGPAQIFGNTTIESGACIGPFCYIKNSHIGKNCEVLPFSHLENAKMAEDARIGPYTRLRPGAVLESGAHAGNFVELKNATLGSGAKANHLAYLGDASIGSKANIGAGTITCNYDGKNKFHTDIGEKAFIGSNSSIVAPVSIGVNTIVGAGSVITRDVPDNCLAIGRSRQKNLPRKLLSTQTCSCGQNKKDD